MYNLINIESGCSMVEMTVIRETLNEDKQYLKQSFKQRGLLYTLIRWT